MRAAKSLMSIPFAAKASIKRAIRCSPFDPPLMDITNAGLESPRRRPWIRNELA